MTTASDGAPASMPKVAAWLTAAGVLPFAGGAVLVWLAPAFADRAAYATLAYGAVILSFIGGIHWGFAAAPDARSRPPWLYVASVVPSLLGWCGLLVGPTAGMALLSAGFVAVLAVDRRALAAAAAPAWWLRLRLPVTASVVCFLGLTVIARTI